ncbi:PIN domain-containing protein [Patescibacteria group bacterium]|nr:PIN domain-containing protein [Patescibacteria group bacterium]
MPNDKKQNKLTRSVILDTNILQYLANEKIYNELMTFLEELVDQDFTLAISDISICELLTGTDTKKEKDCLETLQLFQHFSINENTLVAAARLHNMYNSQKNICIEKISQADRIIGATAILTGSLILTANLCDFPRPIFQEVYTKHIRYNKRERPYLLVIQLLRGDEVVISSELSSRK